MKTPKSTGHFLQAPQGDTLKSSASDSISCSYFNLSLEARYMLLDFRFGPIWDGNLNSKHFRDVLVDAGFLERQSGFQFLTAKGITQLVNMNKLTPDSWRDNPFVKNNKPKNKETL